VERKRTLSWRVGACASRLGAVLRAQRARLRPLLQIPPAPTSVGSLFGANLGRIFFRSGANLGRIFSETIIDGVCFIGTGAAVIISEGHNIESPGDTCTFDGGNDTVNATSEELSLAEQLADNGGPTLTLIPATTSLAVDYLDDPGLCGTSEDQRGELRPQNFVCDVGAVEVVH